MSMRDSNRRNLGMSTHSFYSARPFFKYSNAAPFFGLIWLSFAIGLFAFFAGAPVGSPGDLLAKIVAVTVCTGFVAVGSWLVYQPSKFELHFESGHLLWQELRLLGSRSTQRINAQLVGDLFTTQQTKDNNHVRWNRLQLSTQDGRPLFIFPTLPLTDTERLQKAVETLLERAGSGKGSENTEPASRHSRHTHAAFSSLAAPKIASKNWSWSTPVFVVSLAIGLVGAALFDSESLPPDNVPPRAPATHAFERLRQTIPESAPCATRRYCLLVMVAPWCSSSNNSEYFIQTLGKRFAQGSLGIQVIVGDDEQQSASSYARRFGNIGLAEPEGDLNRLLGDWRYPAWWLVEDRQTILAYWRGGFSTHGVPADEAIADFFDNYLRYPLPKLLSPMD
jgi:hypothetical protein